MAGDAARNELVESARATACVVRGRLAKNKLAGPRYFYRQRFGNALASFVDKRLPSIQIAPCKVCADYHERKEAALDATSFAGEQEFAGSQAVEEAQPQCRQRLTSRPRERSGGLKNSR